MKRVAAAAMTALFGCMPSALPPGVDVSGMRPATQREAILALRLPYLETRLTAAEFRHKAMNEMLDRLEKLPETNPKLIERYYNAFKKLYLKASELRPNEMGGYTPLDKARIETANAIADTLLGKPPDLQTEYVVYSSGFAERNELPLPKAPGKVERALKEAYVFGTVEGTRVDRRTRDECELCGGTGARIAGIYRMHLTATCPKNPTIVKVVRNPHMPPEKMLGLGPHQIRSVVEYERVFVRVGGREYPSSRVFGKGELVIGSPGSLNSFPSGEMARRVQSLLYEVK